MANSSKKHSQEKLVFFETKQIRRTLHDGEWYFSIVEIIEVLTESPNPRRYWSNLKIQLSDNEGFTQLYPKTVQLKLLAGDGKLRETYTANTETVFRIIQSIPSPKIAISQLYEKSVQLTNVFAQKNRITPHDSQFFI